VAEICVAHVPGQTGKYAYGVNLVIESGRGLEYTCGVEVKDFGLIPVDFARIKLAPRTYLIFRHEGHISAIQQTWRAIMDDGLSKAGAEPSDALSLERYGPEFDGATGDGGLDICIPVRV
jgi:AraC family transcriptional regulator